MNNKFNLSSLRRLVLLATPLALLPLAHASVIVKTNNTTALNVATSWTNNAVPGSSDIAQWDSTAATSTTNVLGGSMSWSGINIVNPGAPVVIYTNSGGNVLTLGSSGINMSAASQGLTLSNNVVVPDYTLETWTVPAGLTLSLGSAFTRSGGAALAINNAGTITIAGGTASSTLFYSLVNGTDVGALDASKNLSTVNSVFVYTANVLHAVPSTGYCDLQNANTGTTDDVYLNTSIYYPYVIRFNIPQPNRSYWSWNAYKGQISLDAGPTTILVTTNVGACDVLFNATGSGGITVGWRQSSTGSELIVDQENTAGSIYFNGSFSQKSALASNMLTKRGAGRAVFNVALQHNGPTRILAGEMMVNSSSMASSIFIVNNGATLSGIGGIPSSVTNNGTLWPGTNGLGTLTVSNLTLNAGSGLKFYSTTQSATNTAALLNVTNSVVVNGAVTVSIYSVNTAVGQYPLIKSTSAFSSTAFANFALAGLPLHTQGYLSNNTAASTIDLVITNTGEPLRWATGSDVWNTNYNSIWKNPAGAFATYLEFAGVGDNVLFEDTLSTGSAITVTANSTLVPASTTFSNTTKAYTLSGLGGIAGAGSFTKAGSGLLTMNATNTFTGGLYLNGGIVNFSTLTNLGTGAITFNGGTLQYNGNSDDISTYTVTLGAGGGTIDTAGQTVSFANPIGNSGAGSLTKTGNGTLTLNGTNKYSGNTVVAAGTLQLGGTTYLTNTSAIVIASGAIFDVTAQSTYTLSGRTLAGSGTVNGSLTALNNTLITPGTNGTFGTLTFNSDLALTGATAQGATLYLDLATTNSDLLVVNGSLYLNNANAGTLQINPVNTLTNGTYKLISAGGVGGSVGNLALIFNQANKSGALVLNGSEIDLVVTSSGNSKEVWAGDGGNNYWDIDGSANWLINGVAGAYFDNGDAVVFDDTSAYTTVNIAAPMTPVSVVLNVTNNNYTFQDGSGSGAGKISGTATTLTINGSPANTTIFTAANNYGGPTVINNGATVQVGNGSGGDLGTGNITNHGGALVFNQGDGNIHTVPGQISGTGSLTHEGSVNLVLQGNNTYTGFTSIGSSAVLQVGSGAATGTLGSGALTNDGTLVFDTSGSQTAGGIKTGPNNGGTVEVVGPGTVNLAAGNTYVNNTYISNGVVKLAAAEAIPSTATAASSTGWLVLDGGASSAGTLDLNGFNQTVNALSGVTGTVLGVITNTGTSTTTTNTLTVLETSATTYNGLINDNTSGSKIQLVLRGANQLRLNGASTYSGGTLVGDTATIAFGPGAALGTGSITLSNLTTLYPYNAGSSLASLGNTVMIPDNSAGQFNSASLGNYYYGEIVGGATATNLIIGPFTESASTLQYSNFLGTVVISSAGTLRFDGSSGFVNGGTNAIFDVEGYLSSKYPGSVWLGALEGSGTIGGPNASGTVNYIIGSDNLSTVFSGPIDNGLATSNNAVTKVGTGTLTLNGSLSYLGATVVSNGVLALQTSLDSTPSITLVTNSAKLDISSSGLTMGNSYNQTLSGFGTVIGALYVSSSYGCTLVPGASGTAGTLTINGDLTLYDTTTNSMDFNTTLTTAGGGTNDLIQVNGNLTLNGITYVRPNFIGSGAVNFGVPYTLFKYTGTLTGDSNNLAVDQNTYAHLNAMFSTNTPGAITVTFLGGSNLVWRGDSTNSWQVGVVTNWYDGSSSNFFAQLDSVTFNDTATNFTVSLVGTNLPASVLVNSSSNYFLGGSGKISGTTSLTKAGTGTLYLSNSLANDFSGDTVVSNGIVQVGATGALSTNSSLQLAGGTVELAGFSPTVAALSGTGTINNSAAAASTLTIGTGGSGIWAGTITNTGAGGVSVVLNGTNDLAVTGANYLNSTNASRINNGTGTLTLPASGSIFSSLGQIWIGCESVVTGKVVVAGGSLVVSNWIVVGRDNTNANGTLIVNSGTVQKTGSNNIVVGSLGASGTLTVIGGQVLNNGMLWVGENVGANATVNLNGGLLQATQVRTNGTAPNTSVINFNGGTLQATAASTNFIAGVVANVENGGLVLDDNGYVLSLALSPLQAAGTGGLTKQGAGTVYLDAANTYTGATLVSTGLLAGSGSLVSPVTVGSSGSLGAGDAAAVGKLTIANSLAIHGSALFRISKTGGVKTNDQVAGLTSVTYGGTLVVSNLTTDSTALAAGDTFTLFSATSHSQKFSSISGSPGAGLGYTFTNGVLTVVGTMATNPTNITFSVSGTTLSLAWPADHTGWTLQEQTNDITVGLGTNWVDVAGSASSNSAVITIVPTNPAVFFRLRY